MRVHDKNFIIGNSWLYASQSFFHFNVSITKKQKVGTSKNYGRYNFLFIFQVTETTWISFKKKEIKSKNLYVLYAEINYTFEL